MAVNLTTLPQDTPKTADALPPLAPINDPDTGQAAVCTQAGVKLAIVARKLDAPADTWQLARFRAARAATADYAPAVPAKNGTPAVPAKGKPARLEGWTPTSKLQDIARAMEGGLLR